MRFNFRSGRPSFLLLSFPPLNRALRITPFFQSRGFFNSSSADFPLCLVFGSRASGTSRGDSAFPPQLAPLASCLAGNVFPSLTLRCLFWIDMLLMDDFVVLELHKTFFELSTHLHFPSAVFRVPFHRGER